MADLVDEKLVEEMVRDAERAEEPGKEDSRIINKGDAELPIPMVMSIKSAGYVYIYDTRTGERSLTNRNMLPSQLKKRRADGSVVFTTISPGIKPARGTLKCTLHADGANREHYDELGLPVCRKANLTSPFQVKRHMQKRHPVEWATIEEERVAAEKEEDRDFQRMILDRTFTSKEKPEAPLYVSNKDKRKKKNE